MEIFKLGNLYLKNIDLKTVVFNKNVENENRCYARIWGDGSFGNDRCERKIKSGCLCKKHIEAEKRMNGKWWLGLINEPRPENPEHPVSGKHQWGKDKDGNDYVIEKEPDSVIKDIPVKVKRRRGRPKGSKNKK